MPPPSSEQDIKRRARRRLIGAVALTLVAVIVLPLLLEDEPPPSGPLEVSMAPAPTDGGSAPATAPAATPPIRQAAPEPEPAQAIAPRPEAAKPRNPEAKPAAPTQPLKPEAERAPPPVPVSKPAPTPASKPAGHAETFVIQLAALSDADKADALKGRAALAGFPVYTDKAGTLTRVRIGPYKSRDAAEAAFAKLGEAGLDGKIYAQ
ncbi:MAG TPA: SPOR domain-containing protein [Thiobacillaceae bacterium]|nr:SPOR domain-containing protein [Thiobacillaceae bacterium]